MSLYVNKMGPQDMECSIETSVKNLPKSFYRGIKKKQERASAPIACKSGLSPSLWAGRPSLHPNKVQTR